MPEQGETVFYKGCIGVDTLSNGKILGLGLGCSARRKGNISTLHKVRNKCQIIFFLNKTKEKLYF